MAGAVVDNKVTALCGSAISRPRNAATAPPWTCRPEHVTCDACNRLIVAQRNARSSTVQRGAKRGK
jgi:hypothetical protein